jgi:hypothetical protein
MAASFLISDCLEMIFSNLLVKNPNSCTYISNKDIHSCTLVSRYWCIISTPLLYAYPFHHLAYSNSRYDEYPSYYKLIRTLLSCIPKSEIKKIQDSNSSYIQKIYNIFFKESSPSNILTTFNYITFIRGIIFGKILLNINLSKIIRNQKIWLPPYILNDLIDFKLSNISIPIMKYFVKYLCKNCNNLTKLDFPFAISNDELSDDIIKLLTFKNNNGISKLTNLKELSCIYNEDISRKKGKLPKDLYLTLSNSICNLNLLYNERIGSSREANSLSQFISLQKNLQHIILSECDLNSINNNIGGYYSVVFNSLLRQSEILQGEYYSVVFNSLLTQSESLQVLELNYLIFNKIHKKATNSLCLLKNIKELKLYNFEIKENLNSWAENLTKLEVLEFYNYYISPKLEGFLIQLIRSSSNTLTKLILNYHIIRDDHLTQLIPLYLHSLIHLELPEILPDVLINIFQSCTELIYLSTTLSNYKQWENNCKNILRNLGKFIPKNLQKIRFGYLFFSSIELKFFLEECENSYSKLKYIEIVDFEFDDGYFDVAKEFDVKLINLSTSYGVL